jgi:predicted amidohydrolase
MRVALGQFASSVDKADNLRRMLGMVSRAGSMGAELVVFPEAAMVSFEPDRSLAAEAEPLDGPFVKTLAEAAQDEGVSIVAGIFETVPGNERVYNTVVVLAVAGGLVGWYRKIHLFDAFGYRESERMEPGPGDVLLFRQGDLTFGVETCYDLRFPELSCHLAGQGAQVILLPAAWVRGPLKEDHWETLLRARAIENTVYVAAAGQASSRYAGSSMVVDPMGVAVVRAGESEQLITGDLDAERLAAVRRKLPSRENVRPDVYRRWSLVTR